MIGRRVGLGSFPFREETGGGGGGQPGCVEREIMCSKNEAALVCSTYLIETGLNNGPFLNFSCFTIEGISGGFAASALPSRPDGITSHHFLSGGELIFYETVDKTVLTCDTKKKVIEWTGRGS